jgi:hypothetical protein
MSPGYYVHQWDVRLRDLSRILYVGFDSFYMRNIGRTNHGKIIYNCTALYEATMLALKVAILKDWVRMFVPLGTRNTFWWIAHVLMVLNVIYYTASIIVSAFACNPRDAIWDKTIPSKCIDTKAVSDSRRITFPHLCFVLLMKHGSLFPMKQILTLRVPRY